MSVARYQLNRRELLAGGAGLLGGGALAALMTAPAVAADESNGFEGAWLVHVKPDDGSPSYNVLDQGRGYRGDPGQPSDQRFDWLRRLAWHGGQPVRLHL